MIIKISKLAKILKNIHSGIKKGKKNVLSSYVLLKIIKEKMFCISIDEEIEIVSYEILESNDEVFEILIKYDLIYNICKNHSNLDEIKIEKTKRTLDLYVAENIFRLPYVENQVFPTFMHESKLKIKLKIKTQKLKDMLNISLFTSSDNNPKYYLNGILFSLNKNIFNVFSFDGLRFSFSYVFLDIFFEKTEIIVPRNTILEVINMFNNQSETIIMFFDNQIRFVTNNITLTSRIISDIYNHPKIEINDLNNKKIILNTNDIKDAINKISIFCNNESKINFIFKNESFFLNTKNGHEQAIIKLNSNELNFEIKLTIFYTFLNDMLKFINEEFFNLIISQNEQLTIVKEQSSFYIYVITHFN